MRAMTKPLQAAVMSYAVAFLAPMRVCTCMIGMLECHPDTRVYGIVLSSRAYPAGTAKQIVWAGSCENDQVNILCRYACHVKGLL